MNDREQLLGGFFLVGWRATIGIEYMMPYMALDDLCHKSSERSATRSDRVQDSATVLFFRFNRTFDGLDLALNAVDPTNEFFLLKVEMCHTKILYLDWVYASPPLILQLSF